MVSATSTKAGMAAKARGVIRLSRWAEYLPAVFPLTLFGALLALREGGISLDWRLIFVFLANMLSNAYGFMINDIEDAPDDALEMHRAAKNAVTNGELTVREGWLASAVVAALSLLCYAFAGLVPLLIGTVTLLLCHFYSWKPIRLKAWPVVDVISHSLMLSGLLFLAGYFTYGTNPGIVWLLAIATTLISVYGQLYNQLRDFEMDKAAGLKNTSIMIGQRNARLLMYAAILGCIGLMLYALYIGIIPLWLMIVPVIITPVFFLYRPSHTDMRGTAIVDFTGNVQSQVLVVACCMMMVWTAAVLLKLA